MDLVDMAQAARNGRDVNGRVAATDDDDERRMLLRLALLNGIPWTLAAEAAASVALSRDDEVGTYSLEEEQ
jgi:hypothetical protein